MPSIPKTKQCERCGAEFTTPNYRRQRFCGPSCAGKSVRPAKIPNAWRVPRDRELLHRLYVDEGESTVTLAKRFGVEPPTINRVLRELKIPVRAKGESNFESGRRRAQEVMRIGKMHPNEVLLSVALFARDIRTVPAFAVDKFNIDLAIPEVRLAIEVDGGSWHMSDAHLAGDAAKILTLSLAGWSVMHFSTRRDDWIDQAVAAVRLHLERPQR